MLQPCDFTNRLFSDQAAIAAEESPAASTSSLKSYSTTCSFTGNSSISVITGHEAAVVLDEKYVAGHIFDLSNGEAYDKTPDENGQLIGVLRGKKMCVQPCSGGNRTAVNSVMYECIDGDSPHVQVAAACRLHKHGRLKKSGPNRAEAKPEFGAKNLTET
ncbi:hypothetical protein L596_025148 [Steinernema carpocapsae]|uniref:Uncharacterized protein n=1 Tax=Steinernema carpocapsae TaxID=34508 RepID=A0A4U5M6Y3_STECR|nr:hypothetical protein L596_025148 [Steinernema carpocapsae]